MISHREWAKHLKYTFTILGSSLYILLIYLFSLLMYFIDSNANQDFCENFPRTLLFLKISEV